MALKENRKLWLTVASGLAVLVATSFALKRIVYFGDQFSDAPTFKNIQFVGQKLGQKETQIKKALTRSDPATVIQVFDDTDPEPATQHKSVPGIFLDPHKAPKVINSSTLADFTFQKAGYTGKWLKLIGDPVEPYNMMIWSKPGKGKSSLAIEFAYYLASQHGKKILYISKDEGNASYTMQEKFERLNAFHPNIFVSDGSVPDKLDAYDYVVFDLMNDFEFDYKHFKFNYLVPYNKKGVSFISIFKATVDGLFRGNKDWENMFDLSININDEGYAQAQKNRFGAFGVIKFLQGKTEKIYKYTGLDQAERHKQKLMKDDLSCAIVNGTDGKFWVVSREYAEVLKEQGFSEVD